MTTSNVAIDEGTADKRAATYSISEDAVTKEIQRVAGSDQNGVEGMKVAGFLAVVSANFTRPADTTAYATGDLVANSTAFGSVTPFSFSAARYSGGSGIIRRARLLKTTTSITNASFKLHLYGSSPTVANGDNGAWSSIVAGYLGSVDLVFGVAFSDDAMAVTGQIEIPFIPASGSTIYGLLEARLAYTPGSEEVFTVYLDVLQN